MYSITFNAKIVATANETVTLMRFTEWCENNGILFSHPIKGDTDPTISFNISQKPLKRKKEEPPK